MPPLALHQDPAPPGKTGPDPVCVWSSGVPPPGWAGEAGGAPRTSDRDLHTSLRMAA